MTKHELDYSTVEIQFATKNDSIAYSTVKCSKCGAIEHSHGTHDSYGEPNDDWVTDYYSLDYYEPTELTCEEIIIKGVIE